MPPLTVPAENDDDDDIILVSSTKERWERLHGIEPRREYKDRIIDRILSSDSIDDEDDILVVAVPPTPKRSKANALTGWRTFGSFQNQFNAVVIALAIWMTIRLTKIPKSKISKALLTTSKIESKVSGANNRERTDEAEDAIEVSGSRQDTQSSAFPSTTMLSSFERNDSICVSKPQSTREIAQQFARDVQLVKEVLAEHSLDPSLAPQLAISMHSSQKIIESQRELSYRTALLDAQQRSLDRQLSEEQHRESLQSAKYDPNWKEKLKALRDKSSYWNKSNGGISRLWWEVLSIQQLAVGIVPIWQQYWNNGQGAGLAMTSILKDTLVSVLAQICDCDSTAKAFAGVESAGTESSTPISQKVFASPTSLYFVLTSVLDRMVPAPIEEWTCYGYCAILAFCLLSVAILCHQGLRILSLPPFLHHVVNLAVTTLFCGPQRMLAWVVATVMKMIMIVPSSDSFESQYSIDRTSASVASSFLLLSLWVFFPLWSWQRTSSIYQEAVRHVSTTDPVNFEISLRNERSRLKQWYQHQMTLRYLLLSLYSALVLWENVKYN